MQSIVLNNSIIAAIAHKIFDYFVCFESFHQAKQNAILVILVHSKRLLTRPLVMYVLEEHMQTSLDSKSVSNALIALVVQMEAVYVPFVLTTSIWMIGLQLAHQSFRIHPNIAYLVHQIHFVEQTQHSLILASQRTTGGAQETPHRFIIVNAVAHV
jgi:hypothetical protein